MYLNYIIQYQSNNIVLFLKNNNDFNVDVCKRKKKTGN